MELSKRLQAVADLLFDSASGSTGGGRIVADVGTDHGYIPIYLVEAGLCPKAFAMDVNQGPLLRAKEHIEEHHLQEKIETRLSDGVNALAVGECDFVIVAGMGGALTIKILTEGGEVFRNLKEFVLQPQSEISKVRAYLYENGYRIMAEDMVLDDGKFYPMMRVQNGADESYSADENERALEFSYGKCLLAEKHPILKMFLEKELATKSKILSNLKKVTAEQQAEEQTARRQIMLRQQELAVELSQIKCALGIF